MPWKFTSLRFRNYMDKKANPPELGIPNIKPCAASFLFLNNLDPRKTEARDISYQMFLSKEKSRLWFSVKFCVSSCPADTLRGLSGAWPQEEDGLLYLQQHHFSKHISQPWGARCPANQILLWMSEDFVPRYQTARGSLALNQQVFASSSYLSNLRHFLSARVIWVFIKVTSLIFCKVDFVSFFKCSFETWEKWSSERDWPLDPSTLNNHGELCDLEPQLLLPDNQVPQGLSI